MKILIIKLSAIGDIVHTLPTLAAIRERFPEAEISWVAEQRSSEILRGNKMIDNLIEVDTRSLRGAKVDKLVADAAKQIKNLRQYDFDIAIDFQGLLKSAIIAKLSGAKKRWGASRADLREPGARVFYTKTAKIPPGKHIVWRNLSLASAALDVDLTTDELSFPIATTDVHRQEAAEIVERVDGRFAILNPAGGWITKLWHAEKFGSLADMIWEKYGLSSIVVTGPNEAALANEVMSASRSGKAISTQPSLKGFYELAKRAEIYVGGDTGPTHLAIAAGTPIVGIFGPTEWWRNGSLNPDDICVERTDIACRVDCHRRTCSKWICMDITADVVMKAVDERMMRVGSQMGIA